MSIQSFHAGDLWERIPPDHFASLVVDELHHAEAPQATFPQRNYQDCESRLPVYPPDQQVTLRPTP